MKNKLIKIILIILTLVMIFNNYKVYASAMEDIQEGLLDPTTNPNVWNPNPNIHSQNGEWDVLFEKAGVVLGFINVAGIVILVITLMAMGIKYMIGSVEEKAEYKKAILPYVLGAFFIAASTSIANIIYTLATWIF